MGSPLAAWHDFYILLGGAAATLVGLTFIAASIAGGILTTDHEAGLNTFITPTVVHFAAILFAALLILAPADGGASAGILILVVGIVGMAYSIGIWLYMRRAKFAASIILTDRVWYALMPVVAYAVVAGAAFALTMGRPAGVVLAGGFALLLLAGIRNAWDMTLWIVMQPRDKPISPPPPP